MNPKLFLRVGIKPPKGVLLYGPPGIGKTLLARDISSNIDANFLKIFLNSEHELLMKFLESMLHLRTEYGRLVNTFSPEGRLFQVEYAIEAIKLGSTAIGIKTKERCCPRR